MENVGSDSGDQIKTPPKKFAYNYTFHFHPPSYIIALSYLRHKRYHPRPLRYLLLSLSNLNHFTSLDIIQSRH